MVPSDPGYEAYVGLFQHDVAASLMIGMVLTVVLRAAIVPSRVTRTVLLTIAVGTITAVIMTIGAVPLEGGEPIRNHTPPRYVLLTMLNHILFWTLTTVVCVAISRIVYGLRREVRRAHQLGQYTLVEKHRGRRHGLSLSSQARHDEASDCSQALASGQGW